MPRRRWIQTESGFVEISTVRRPRPPTGPYIVGDLPEHYNHQTGEMVSSRKRHREILREHGLIELGNEWEAFRKQAHNPDFDDNGKLIHRDKAAEAPEWVDQKVHEWLTKTS